jgi:uncharacterized protein YgiM (DUF1202 family)
MRYYAFLLTALVVLSSMPLARAEQASMSVQVKQGAVRSTPSFVGQVVGNLNYGDRVLVTEQKPGWMKVSAGGVSGWMHVSSLTEKRVVVKAGTGTVQTGATSEEMALAGKGFTADVEAQFRAQNRSANFAAVNRMEQRQVTQQELMQFLRTGGVSPREGGAQ